MFGLKKKLGRQGGDDVLTLKPVEETVTATDSTVTEAPAEETPVDNGNESTHLKVIRPEAYDEVGSVADCLLEGCTVVLNTEALDNATMMRMLNFLNGVTYCTNGAIKKVAASTFVITPHGNVDITDM